MDNEEKVSANCDEAEDVASSLEERDEKDIKIEALNDQYVRLYAEFDNYRKRVDKEKASMYDLGVGEAITQLLPVIDSFERGLVTADEGEKNAFETGMNMVYTQFKKTLEELGVAEIEALGKEFDTNYHNAVMHIDDATFGKKEIIEVLQKGYTYKNRVIRHSMVKVAN